MCRFSWFTTVVIWPHKSQTPRCITVTTSLSSQNLTGSKRAFRPGGDFPNSCQTSSCSRAEKCDPVEENGKRIQNNRASASSLRRRMRRRSRNQRRVMPFLCFPSSPFFTKLLSLVFFFSFRRLVLCFFAQISWLYSSGRRDGGGARTADGENLGKIALAFFASLSSPFT